MKTRVRNIKYQRSLAKTFILYVLAFSSLITLLGTVLQLYRDYSMDVKLIETRMDQIEESYLKSIVQGLWVMDRELIQIQLDGVLNLPDIEYVGVRKGNESIVALGSLQSQNIISRVYPLRFSYRGQNIHLGDLYVRATLSGVYARLWDRLLLIAGTQAVKTFLVSLFIFFLFYFLVGRHLLSIARYAKSVKIDHLDAPLKLARPINPQTHRDEIDQLVTSINEMRANLKMEQEEKAKLEARLRQSLKMEAIGTLAGGIAHDFNNILTTMIGYAEMSREDIEDDHSVASNLDEILKAGFRARDLIKQILSFSRQSSFEKKPLQLHVMVSEILAFLSASIPPNIEVQKRIATDAGFVMADSSQMHQVVMNLCTNAYYAMQDQGGRLTISLTRAEIPSNYFEHNTEIPAGVYVCLKVADTGHGMTDDVQEKIFEPYFSTKPHGEGSGMGLSVVHGIVKNHGGVITVDSSVGKGSRFAVYLPHLKDLPEDNLSMVQN